MRNMHSFKVKSTTESGLLAAITVIMALMAVYLPLIGIAATLLWPLPIIVLIVRHGIKYGVLSVAAAAIIMTMLISPVSAVHMVAAFGPTSLALGYGFYRGLSASRILLYGITASLFGVFLTAGMTMLLTGVNPLAMAEQIGSMKEAADAAFQMYAAMGMSADTLAKSKQDFMDAMEYIAMLLPMIFFLSGTITAWLNFAIGGRVLRRLGHPVTALPDFDAWRLPKVILYIFGFALVGMYWGSRTEIELLQQVSLNAYVFSTLAGFIQGASVLSSIARDRISRWLFWLLMAFIFLNGAISQLLAIFGLFDVIFDYRKRFGLRS